MKKNVRFKILFGIMLLMSLGSCSDFLDRAPTAELDVDQVFSDFELAKKYQLRLYATLRGGFFEFAEDDYSVDWGYDLLSNMDDHSLHSKSDCSTQELIKGGWTGVRSEKTTWGAGLAVARKWRFSYQAIRSINIFLENYSRVPLASMEQQKEMDILVGEAYFLRAHHYLELVKRWGGVPIMRDIIAPDKNYRPVREDVKTCLDYIVEDCMFAAEKLPVKVSSLWEGRVTKGAALGLKARTLLYGASPYWVQKGSGITWKQAADAALEVINLKDENGAPVYELLSDYRDVFLKNFNKEIIYCENTSTKQFWGYYTIVPTLMGGFSNGMMASQEFVDCYEIKDEVSGKYVPFDRNNPEHMANMYNKDRRDPRFDMTLFYNGSKWQGETLGFYEGGNVWPKEGDKNFYLGYCFKKYLNESVRGASMGGIGAGGTFVFNWIFMRYADVLLMYAEAQNQVGGPNSIGGDGVGGLTALQALNLVRNRGGHGISEIASSISPDDFDEKVRNERAVELVIEDQRFFDVRRWNIADQVLSKPLHGVKTIKVGDTFQYDFNHTDGPVRKKWDNCEQYFLYPINIEELQRNPNLEQNPGWIDIVRE